MFDKCVFQFWKRIFWKSKFQKWPFLDHFWSFFGNYIDIFHKTEIQMFILRCLMGLNLEFWKYDSRVPSDVSKHTPVWNKHNLSLKYWCIEAKLVFCTSYGPKKLSKCHLGALQTTFSENSNYYRGNIGENLFLSSLKMHYFRGSLPKWVLTPQKKTSCHIFKMDAFSKFFGDFMSHIIM